MPPNTSSASLRQPSHDDQGRPAGDHYYRAFMRCYVDQANSEVVVRFHKTNIVRIRPNGDVILTTGTWYTATTQMAMNDALEAMGMEAFNRGPVSAKRWAVTDGEGNEVPFEDGVTIPGTTAAHRERGKRVLQAFNIATALSANKPITAAVRPAPVRAGAPSAVRPAAIPQSAWGASGLTAAQRLKQGVAAGAGAGGLAWAQPQQAQQQQQAWPGMDTAAAPAARTPKAPLLSVEEQLAKQAEQLGMENDLEDDHLCILCMHQARDTVLVPCGHMIMCSSCCSDYMQKGKDPECPVCRDPIIETCQVDL